jgi:hypothetical protein
VGSGPKIRAAPKPNRTNRALKSNKSLLPAQWHSPRAAPSPPVVGATRKNSEGVELLLPPVPTGGKVAAFVSEAPEGGDTLLATGVNRWLRASLRAQAPEAGRHSSNRALQASRQNSVAPFGGLRVR